MAQHRAIIAHMSTNHISFLSAREANGTVGMMMADVVAGSCRMCS